MPWIYSSSNQLDNYGKQLDRIEHKLDRIVRLERRQMANEQELDAALSNLSTQLEGLQQAAASIIEKVSTVPDVPDLSDEIATIEAFGAKVAQTTDEIATAVAPAEPATAPAEPLPEEPAV